MEAQVVYVVKTGFGESLGITSVLKDLNQEVASEVTAHIKQNQHIWPPAWKTKGFYSEIYASSQ